MEAVYPAAASALTRGRRPRPRPPASRQRRRTLPVTFAEIKEVDEENEGRGEECESSEAGDTRRRRPDMLEEQLGRQFLEFRRRRARGDALCERDPEPEPTFPSQRAGSEPAPARGT